jgi:hypothetical protein
MCRCWPGWSGPPKDATEALCLWRSPITEPPFVVPVGIVNAAVAQQGPHVQVAAYRDTVHIAWTVL